MRLDFGSFHFVHLRVLFFISDYEELVLVKALNLQRRTCIALSP